uniref:Protein AF-10 n=1 Tax=Xenopus tropicalis TaxID=8364 RepID=A0A6I8SV94_XENTR
MSNSTPNREVCAFCQQGEQNKKTGDLLQTSDGEVTAHYYCMLFSPNVITTSSPDEEFGGFDRRTVENEIKRGRKMKCSSCNKVGGTIGCNKKSCRKTYHYMCAETNGALIIENQEEENYIIYCTKHRKGDKQGDDQYSSDSTDPGPPSRISDASNIQQKQRDPEDTTPRCKRHLISSELPRCDGRTPSPGKRPINEDQDADNVTSEIPHFEQSEGLHVGDRPGEHNAIAVSTEGNSADDSYAKRAKLARNCLAEVPKCSAYAKNCSNSKSLLNSCRASSPIEQSTSVVQNRNSTNENNITVAQHRNASSGDLQSKTQFVTSSQTGGASRPVVPNCLKDLPVSKTPKVKVAQQTIIPDAEITPGEQVMGEMTAVLPSALPGVQTQSAEPSENIHGMNSRLCEQPVIVPGEGSKPTKHIRTNDINMEHSMSISDCTATLERSSEGFSESNSASAEEDMHYVEVICIPMSQESTAAKDCTNVKISSEVEASCSFKVRDTEKQEGPFANIDYSSKLKVFSEFVRIKDQINTGAAKQFWTMCQENQCCKPLLEMIESSVRSVTQKVLNREAENEDYETAFRYLCASRKMESVFVQEIEEIIQALNKAKELLQAVTPC